MVGSQRSSRYELRFEFESTVLIVAIRGRISLTGPIVGHIPN
jgi:hypothetical protein